MGAPTQDGRPWTTRPCTSILRNPKYTGRVVLGRTRNAGTGKRAGEKKIRSVPREHWTWAADGNEHPALISMELWEAAQDIGRQRGKVRDYTAQRPGARTTTRCAPGSAAPSATAACAASPPPAPPAPTTSAPTTPTTPATQPPHPGHVRAAIRDTTIHAAIDDIMPRCCPATAPPCSPPSSPPPRPSRHPGRRHRRRGTPPAGQPGRGRHSGLMTQLEQLGSDTSPAANAYRQRIRDQFTTRYNQRPPPRPS